jgi:uncharacterized protein involved in exopolysaccharide biosynthesis
LVVLGAILLFAAAAPLAVLKSTPEFEARGVLLVSPEEQPTLSGRTVDRIPGDFGDYVRTVVARANSYELLSDVLGGTSPEQWPQFLNPDLPLEANVYKLMGRLRVRELPRTFLVELRLRAHRPEGLDAMLNGLMAGFIDKLRREQENQFGRQLAYLRAEREGLRSDISGLRQKVITLADDVGSAAFLSENYEAHLYRVAIIQEQQREAEMARLQAVAENGRAVALAAAVNEVDITPLANIRIADNYGINRMEMWTYERRQDLRGGIDGLTPENLDRQYVEERMEAMQEFLLQYREDARARSIRNLELQRGYELTLERMDAAAAATAATAAAETLDEQLAAAQAEADRVSRAIYEADALSTEISKAEDRLAALGTRIHDTELLAKAQAPVMLDQLARAPAEPASNNLVRLLMAALALAIAASAGGCLVFDLLDNRIRTLADLEAATGGRCYALPAGGPEPALQRLAARLCRVIGDGVVLVAGDGSGQCVEHVASGLRTALSHVDENVSDEDEAPQVACLPTLEAGAAGARLVARAAAIVLVARQDVSSYRGVREAMAASADFDVPAIAPVLVDARPAPGTWLCEAAVPAVLRQVSSLHQRCLRIVGRRHSQRGCA